MEPKQYAVFTYDLYDPDIDELSDKTVRVFRADDPAVVERFRKAEALDKLEGKDLLIDICPGHVEIDIFETDKEGSHIMQGTVTAPDLLSALEKAGEGSERTGTRGS